ncbi:MAG: cytochrome c biogenesis protein CcdA [Saprospiraceae bacterium]
MSFVRILSLVFILSFSLQAQILDPVHWDAKITSLGNQEYQLLITAKMDKGWAIYSQTSDPDAAIPSEITIEKMTGLSLLGQVEEIGHIKKGAEPLFDNKIVAKYYDKVEFIQKFKADTKIKNIKASAYFMSCNSETCIPPTNKNFTLNLNPENNSSAISDQANEQTVSTENTPIASINLVPQKNDLFDPVKLNGTLKKINDKEYEAIFEVIIDKGWQIYSSYMAEGGPLPTQIEMTKGEHFSLLGKIEELGEHKTSGFDELFEMDVVKFKEEVKFIQKINVNNANIPIKGFFTYQSCDASKCLPPKSIGFEIHPDKMEMIIEGSNAHGSNLKIDGNKIDQTVPQIKESLPNPIGNCGEEKTKGTNLFWTFLIGFLGGLVALLTPCVFPMIPLTVSYFTKGSKDKKSGIRNGLLYAMSIVIIYVLIGLLITSLFGATALNELSTSWIANVLFFLIFIFFAFSFFGYYEITLPSSWSNKSDAMADKGGFIGIFFMAFTLALVSFSCTGPIIGSAIVESAKNPVGPSVVMLGFSLALALPFGLFAAFPAWLNSLPKSGSWMTNVKVVLGFLELALALKFLSVADMTKHWGILGYELFLGLWVVVFALTSIYLFGWIKFPHDSKIKKLSTSRLIFAFSFAILSFYLGTGFRYSEEFQSYKSLKIMSGLAPPSSYNYFLDKPEINKELKSRFISFTKCANNIDCFHDYYEALTYAKEQGKPLMVDFTGYGCVNCRKTEEHIWVDDKIRNSLNKDYVLVSLYVDDREPLHEELVSSTTGNPIRNIGNKWADFQIVNFNQNSQPLYIIMSPDEKVLAKPRGFREGIEDYNTFLQCGLSAFKEYSTSIGLAN